MLKAKIVISISGGCITTVWSDIPGTEVYLFDWDDIREKGKREAKKQDRRLNRLTEDMTVAY